MSSSFQPVRGSVQDTRGGSAKKIHPAWNRRAGFSLMVSDSGEMGPQVPAAPLSMLQGVLDPDQQQGRCRKRLKVTRKKEKGGGGGGEDAGFCF